MSPRAPAQNAGHRSSFSLLPCLCLRTGTRQWPLHWRNPADLQLELQSMAEDTARWSQKRCTAHSDTGSLLSRQDNQQVTRDDHYCVINTDTGS
jgi:hypothetical protein